MSLPLVTCLCLTTAGRSKWLPIAVECFRKQTYQNKELLIVADSWSDVDCILDESGAVPPGFNISVYIPLHRPQTIGAKRNLACESAAGQIIVNWDDDDYSVLFRIEEQVIQLIDGRGGLSSHCAVTGFNAMKFTDGEHWWKFRIGEGFVIGSSLAFHRSWLIAHPFPELQIGEDAGFCAEAFQAGKLGVMPDLNLMYATIHEGNTSKRRLDQPGWIALPNFKWE